MHLTMCRRVSAAPDHVYMQGTVRSGTDGSFRMTIEDKYAQLAACRARISRLYPAFLTLAAVKSLWLSVPFFTDYAQADSSKLAIFAGACAASAIAWLVGGLGGRKERLVGILAFHVLTIIAIGDVRHRSLTALPLDA
jgi:hypothetical protein